MNTRRDFIGGLIVMGTLVGASALMAQPTNNIFVIDNTLNYTIWDSPQAIGPTVRLLITSKVRKEIAAWLSNDTPVCYVEGAEYFVYRVTLSADRATIELMRM